MIITTVNLSMPPGSTAFPTPISFFKLVWERGMRKCQSSNDAYQRILYTGPCHHLHFLFWHFPSVSVSLHRETEGGRVLLTSPSFQVSSSLYIFSLCVFDMFRLPRYIVLYSGCEEICSQRFVCKNKSIRVASKRTLYWLFSHISYFYRELVVNVYSALNGLFPIGKKSFVFNLSNLFLNFS